MPRQLHHLDASSPVHDERRLDALARSGLLDSVAEPRFDRLTALVRELIDVPVALISLVGDDRQFFKSCLGLPELWASKRETPLSHSFCQYVVHHAEPLVIEDTRAHPFLHDNVAARELGVVAYAGMPITNEDGVALGSLCAIDTVPRAWTERQLGALAALAAAVSSEIALHAHAEGVMARADASYREVVDALGEVVFRADSEGRWTWLTPAWTRLTGYGIQESLGSPIRDLLLADEREHFAEQIRGFLHGDESTMRGPIPFRRADGSTGWAGIRAHLTYDASGNVSGMLGTLNDVTRRVEEQRLLQETRDRLADAQKLEALGQLAASIAHDFNNILAGAGGYADLLRTDPSLNEEARSDAVEIIAVVDQGRRLVRKLLDFGNPAVRSSESIRMNDVAADVVRTLRPTLGEAITLEAHLGPMLPVVQGDRTGLEQVLANLLVNARDAMPDGGRITVSTSVEDDRDGGQVVCVTVRDTGVGMDEATRARIFEPFFTTKSTTGGSGLGLATVHGIVTRMRGRLEVESTLGEGTTFRVVVPAGCP
jgi:PAS domain S-box-containing protein